MSADHVANDRENQGFERAKRLGEAIETRVLYARPASTEGHAERVTYVRMVAVTGLLTIFHGAPAPDKILC